MGTTPSEKPKTVDKYQLSYRIYEGIFSTIKALLKYGSIVLIVRYGYYAVLALAGKQTFADVGFRILGNVQISHNICYLVATGGILYGVGQRTMRRRHIKRVDSLKNNYERMLDPRRTSSGLTHTGQTRPEDSYE
jgi:hypothetical protein